MKKYLMTGIAALAMCAGFTSCSHDLEAPSQEEINQSDAQKIVNDYNQAFIKTFGQPAANQEWGFGGYDAVTRAANVEGNLWHDPAYYNLENDAPVTTAEKNLVFNYVNNSSNVRTVDQISITDYWVSQIWDGDSDKNADGVMAPVSHSYPNQNGNITDIIGGAQMDKLEIKEAEGKWTHCNNYNNGTNNDWKEGGEGGRTLMTSSGTLSFRYTNSQSSYLSEKYIIVPGENIDASLAGFYYVCFDFERGYAENESEKTMGSYEAWNGNNYQGGWNFSLDGFLNEDQVKAAIGQVNGKDIQNIQIKGYLNGDKHCNGDGNYTDWIVRISPAVTKVADPDNVCIIAEDLSATTGTDFDFNDVVFTVEYTSTTTAKVTLYAAGGTLPLKVAGTEVHGAFGYGTPDEKGLYKMINTGAKANVNDVAPVVLFENLAVDKSKRGNDIEILVDKGTKNEQGVHVPNWIPLTATGGSPAAKLCVGTDYATGKKWCAERESIKDKYKPFAEWVTNKPTLIWWK